MAQNPRHRPVSYVFRMFSGYYSTRVASRDIGTRRVGREKSANPSLSPLHCPYRNSRTSLSVLRLSGAFTVDAHPECSHHVRDPNRHGSDLEADVLTSGERDTRRVRKKFPSLLNPYVRPFLDKPLVWARRRRVN